MHPPLQQAQDNYRAAEASGADWRTLDRLMAEWREAVEATESTDQRCFRLGLMAADKDAEAERHFAAAADAAGRAASRRLKFGADETMAASLQREADHCTKLGEEADAEAVRLRSQAASLRRAQELINVVRAA